MFSIFKKRQEITLDCFTTLPHAYDHAKISTGGKFFPDWWQKTGKITQDSEGNDWGTIKSCRGFIDLYKHSVIIPSWFSLQATIFSKSQGMGFHLHFSDEDLNIKHSHGPFQFKGFAKDTGQNIKFTSPWAFKTKEDVHWTWTQPTWNMEELIFSYSVLPAVVNYKYQHNTNINLFVEARNEEYTFFIPPLTPLVMLHPLTDKKIKIENHLVDEKEYNRIFGIEKLLLRRNLHDEANEYNLKKTLVNKSESLNKCPFGK